MPKRIKIGSAEDERVKAKYPAIVLWGKELLSFDYYILDQCYLAEAEDAPQDAIYRDDKGVWHTVKDMGNPEIKARFQAVLEYK